MTARRLNRPRFHPLRPGGPALSLCLCACLLNCGVDYNPYADATNARAILLHSSFESNAKIDTVSIFATHSLSVVVALREKVDSFRVVIPSSRLGDTITVGNSSSSPIEAKEYTYEFSLTDTGYCSIEIQTFRDNGDVVSERHPLFRRSPLAQEPVTAQYGHTVTLETDSVSDTDVWYHWGFNEEVVVNSPLPAMVTTIEAVSSDQGTGRLWVSDHKNLFASPSVPFTYHLGDTLPPTIGWVTDGVALRRGDTIFTGDTLFLFRVNIQDSGRGVISRAEFNGKPFDEVYRGVYSASVSGHAASSPSSILPVRVSAEDRYGNGATADFLIAYDSTLTPSRDFILTVLSPASSPSVTSSGRIPLIGTVEDYTGDTLEVDVSLEINGLAHEDTITAVEQRRVIWQWTAGLSPGDNTLKIAARDLRLDRTVDTSIVVTYRPGIKDTTPPVIAEVTTGGRDAANAFVDGDSAALKIIAFDEASGIDSLTVNGRPTQIGDRKGIYSSSVPLSASSGENPVSLRAVDNAGNADTLNLVIYRNSTPRIRVGLDDTTRIRAGTPFFQDIFLWDSDGDSVWIDSLQGPSGMEVRSAQLRWTPTVNQLGSHQVHVWATDGLQRVLASFSLEVIGTPAAPCSLSVTSSSSDIVNNVVTLFDTTTTDTLLFTIHDSDLPALEHYHVTVIHDSTVTFSVADTTRTFHVVVDPLNARDTSEQLVVTIKDRSGYRDTLSLRLRFARTLVPGAILAFNTTPTGADVAADVADFPVPVNLNTANFDFSPAADGASLVFTDEQEEILPCQVERWDPDNETAHLWVLVDTVFGNADTQYIMAKWDMSGTRADTAAYAVFDTSLGFGGVWHLGLGYRDATPNGYDGTNHGTVASGAGIVGSGAYFNGVDSYVDIGANSTIASDAPALTLSAWVRQKDYTVHRYQSIIALSQPSTTPTSRSRAGLSLLNRGRIAAFGRSAEEDGQAAASDSLLSLGQWAHLVAVIDFAADSIVLYHNGTAVLRQGVDFEQSATTPDPSHGTKLGAQDDASAEFLYADLDEVRVERVRRSDAWLMLCYESQKPSGSFLRFLSVEAHESSISQK